MNIPDLKQLDKLVQLCRKRGVKVIKIDNMELTLSDEAPTKSKKKQELPAGTPSIFESDSLTDEQLLQWSVMEVPPAKAEAGSDN